MIPDIVLFAGAGVSAGAPASLPQWKPLNRLIANALCDRVEAGLQRPGWLDDARQAIEARRDADRFPPEYQAQLIEEMSGERYFRALQALDIDAINPAHDAIAALAATGRVRAIVTTNFDRLIERALERRGVAYAAAYDDAGFAAVGNASALPVIKIHGCVSDHRSMIDTLKQRRLGRSAALERCLDPLHSSHWIYAGFSAADLVQNPDYLGLRRGAARSPGATFIRYPGTTLGPGALTLKAAYAERWIDVETEVAQHLDAMSGNRDVIAAGAPRGPELVRERLKTWADSLTLSAAALCLTAMLEAIGEAERGVRILDRIVRKEWDERDNDDFPAVQLHYGRLGAAWGRFINVPDLNGAMSNASVESMQSLMRIIDTRFRFEAASWLGVAFLWHDRYRDARGLLSAIGGDTPPSHEAAADAWLTLAQLMFVNTGQRHFGIALSSYATAIREAAASGDAVRVARVIAMRLLLAAETNADVLADSAKWSDEFAEAERLEDGFALGMRALAIGRWHTGAAARDPAAALAFIDVAIAHFERQGMDPWILFALLQQAKALADLQRFDDVTNAMRSAGGMLRRFTVFASHFYEVDGQLRSMIGDDAARSSFATAIEAATESGLDDRAQFLQRYV